jgi:hypothetical protein
VSLVAVLLEVATSLLVTLLLAAEVAALVGLSVATLLSLQAASATSNISEIIKRLKAWKKPGRVAFLLLYVRLLLACISAALLLADLFMSANLF